MTFARLAPVRMLDQQETDVLAHRALTSEDMPNISGSEVFATAKVPFESQEPSRVPLISQI